MYYRTDTKQVFATHSDVRESFMTGDTIVLFSDIITDEDLAARDTFPLVYQKPDVEAGKIAVEADVELVDGVWTQQWTVRDITPEESVAASNALDSLRSAKNDEINTWRAQANLSTFPHVDKLIACDALSRSDIDGVANNIGLSGGFPAGFPMAWKAVDNTFISLANIDAFKAMYASMTAQGTANFNRAQELKTQLAAATTAEEIAAIAW